MIIWRCSGCSTPRRPASGSSRTATTRARSVGSGGGHAALRHGRIATSSPAPRCRTTHCQRRLPLGAGATARRAGAGAGSVRSHRPYCAERRRRPQLAARCSADASRAIRARMIAVQEELDWEVYRLYGLIDEDLTYAGDDLPGLDARGAGVRDRAGRAVAAGEEETAWFTRHGSTPITEIPAHWPEAYRELVQRRLDSSRPTRRSGCWRGRSTSGGGRRSRGRSSRSGRCGTGCWTGWRTSGSGSMRRAGRCRAAWPSWPTR